MSPRRSVSENSETRVRLLDATERVLVEEGYAAVTSRRVAALAGVAAGLVSYYFPDRDSLLLAVFRRRTQEQTARQEEVLAADDLLRSIWRAGAREPSPWLAEFVALANHREPVRLALAEWAGSYRQRQVDVLARRLPEYGEALAELPPEFVQFLLTAISSTLHDEQSVGMTAAHELVRDVVEQQIARLEERRAASPARSA